MMRLAQLISIFGHPLFMPIYAVALIFRFNPYIQLQVSEPLQKAVFLTLAFFTIFLPLLTAIIMKKLGIVQSIYMRTAAERRWPFLFTILWYYLGFEVLTKLPLPPSLYLLLIGAITAILIAQLITLRWKISIHMIGVGGLLGAFIGLSQRFQYEQTGLILALIILAGLIGFARLKTNSHNPQQVYAGFLLGLSVEWLTVFLF